VSRAERFNQKSHRDKLNGEQLAQLAKLGMHWVEEAG
jgi:hypothetical protein